jgi:hypothetical protein
MFTRNIKFKACILTIMFAILSLIFNYSVYAVDRPPAKKDKPITPKFFPVEFLLGLDHFGAIPEKLKEIAEKYHLDIETLGKEVEKYETRPYFIVETPKKRLKTSAKLIGEIVERKKAEEELKTHREHLEELVEEKTINLMAGCEVQMAGLTPDEVHSLTKVATGERYEKRDKTKQDSIQSC